MTPFGISERLKKPSSTSPLATSSPPTASVAWRVFPLSSSRIPSLASAAPAMAPEVLGIAGSVCVSERAASTTAFSFSGVETSGTGPTLLHHHTNTDARERYAAHRREVAGFVVIVHRRHGENDGVERLRRELLVDVKRWSVTLWPVCLSNLAAVAFATICVAPTLRTSTLAAVS